MVLTRYEPWHLLTQLQNNLNNLIDNRDTLADNSKIATGQWTPAVDIQEEANRFVIHADLPGVKPDDLEVTMENGVLTIKGERRTETKKEEAGYSRIERISGSFYRRFSLPDTADQENINAECKNGVLTIIIPKKEKAKPRKIEIKEAKV